MVVHYVEGKGTKIAQLAKEKVQKYRDENASLQQQLDQLKSGAGTADAHVMTASGASELLVRMDHVEVTIVTYLTS